MPAEACGIDLTRKLTRVQASGRCAWPLTSRRANEDKPVAQCHSVRERAGGIELLAVRQARRAANRVKR